MKAGNTYGANALLLCTACLTLSVLTSCSDSSTSYSSNVSGDTTSAATGAATGGNDIASGTQPSGTSETDSPLGLLQDDPGLLQDLPQIVSTEVLADSGLQVAYTSARQVATIKAAYLGAQWQHMQSCLGVNAPAPYVVIVDGAVSPFVATDDVIRDLGGESLATASVTGEGTIVQISAADLDGSFGETGFSLRAIFGRSLWMGANLSLRDYPFACASTEPVPASS